MALRVLVTGAGGQVGAELAKSPPAGVELTAVDRAGLDVTDRAAVLETVERLRPAAIINAAAYTAVDKAEDERDAAFRVNAEAPGHLAEAARRSGARLVHVSTDYVFDGAQRRPYRPGDPTGPLNVYGESKLAGERLVAERTDGAAVVVRTAWVYAPAGSNFVKTMLRLLRERSEVRVVNDQIGAPTHAAALARALWRFAALPGASGCYHWAAAGAVSWYDVACAIREHAAATRPAEAWGRVVPIASRDYPTRARRPAYSVLDCSGSAAAGVPEPWPDDVAHCVTTLLHAA